jgi:uncharacterized membrane protein YfcA
MQDFGFYFQFGWEHIISKDALDHQLFITALAAIYVIKEWKQVLILVTAFTIGHSLTLALSVFDVVRFNTKWVEFIIPCTIVFTAVVNLFQKDFSKKSIRINYLLALIFGLVHGMGFANSLRFMLAEDQHLLQGLFAFNLGIEAGQVILVSLILLLAHFFINVIKINRRDWVLFISGIAFGLALKMSIERFPIHKKNTNAEETSAIKHVDTVIGCNLICTKYTEQCCL